MSSSNVKRAGAPRILPATPIGVQVGVPVRGSVDNAWAVAFRRELERAVRARADRRLMDLLTGLRVDGIKHDGAEIRFVVGSASDRSITRLLDLIDSSIRSANRTARVVAAEIAPLRPDKTHIHHALQSWATRNRA